MNGAVSTSPAATFGPIDADDMFQTVAGGAVADLVVILNEADEVMRGETNDRPAVRALSID